MNTVFNYFSVYQEENEVVLHYADSDELARVYTFATDEAADDFYNACVVFNEMLEKVSEDKQEFAHQVLMSQYLNGIEHICNMY